MISSKKIVKIDGFNDYYICNNGDIIGKNGVILKYTHNNNGYPYAILYKDRKKYTKRPYVLVAQHFIPNPNNLPQVNHKDGDKDNCNDWNLEWSTASSNIKHAYDTGLHKPNIYHNRCVMQTTSSGKVIPYRSIRDAEAQTGIDRSAISRCCNHKALTAGNCRWQFVDERSNG